VSPLVTLFLSVSVSSGFKVFKIIAAAGRILTGNIIANLLWCIPIAPSGADADDEQAEKADDEKRRTEERKATGM